MNQKTFAQVTGVIFAIVAILHLARLIFGWEAMIGGWSVPGWISVLALVGAGYLAYSAWKLSR